jgi:hypothetical protein
VFLDYPLGEIVLEAYRTRCHEGTAGSGSSFFNLQQVTTPNSKKHTKDINQGKYPEYLPEELIGETSIGVGVLIRFRVFGFPCFFLRVGFMTCMCA